MAKLNKGTLFFQYMADTNDDEGAIAFINSSDCTQEMLDFSRDGWCALNLAARLNRYEVVDALIKKGANVNQVSWDSSYNALMYAIAEGDYYGDYKEYNLKTIDLLIKAGTNLNYEDRFSAFTLACELNKTEVVQRLLSYDINVHFKDEKGRTGMDYLIEDNNQEAIQLVEKYILNKKLQSDLPSTTEEVKKPKI